MPRVFVSIGSNIDREKNVRRAIEQLSREFGDVIVSPVYDSAAAGFPGQSFLNLVVGFDTAFGVGSIRKILRQIEDTQGRVRDGTTKFSSRTLDLDLILYGDTVDPTMGLPHPDILNYAFVLKPLADLAPHAAHPVVAETYIDLWRRRFPDGGALTRVALAD